MVTPFSYRGVIYGSGIHDPGHPRRVGSGEADLYQAAIDDENLAKATVRAFSGASLDAFVEATGNLSQGEIAQLGLEPGEVRSAPKTFARSCRQTALRFCQVSSRPFSSLSPMISDTSASLHPIPRSTCLVGLARSARPFEAGLVADALPVAALSASESLFRLPGKAHHTSGTRSGSCSSRSTLHRTQCIDAWCQARVSSSVLVGSPDPGRGAPGALHEPQRIRRHRATARACNCIGAE
jgi:hypothetical protein